MTRSVLRLLALGVLLSACQSISQGPSPRPPLTDDGIESLADEYLAAWLERYPETGTRRGLAGARHDRLLDNSAAALSRWHTQEDGWLQRLRALPEPPVGSRDWLTRGLLLEALEASRAARICRRPLWETSSTTGWHRSLPFVFDVQPVATAKERRWALERLAALEPYIDTEIANLHRGLAAGYSSPQVTVAGVPGEVRVLLGPDSPFQGMAERANDEPFASAVAALLRDRIHPAIERFARFIETDYLPAARQELAVSAHPDGAACYRALVRSFSTLSRDPAEVHRLGQRQMAVIREEMRSVLAAYAPGESLTAFLRRLAQDPTLTFESEDAVLAYNRKALRGARAAMSRAFHDLPKAQVLVKPYPAYAASGVGEYHASSEDGSRPGIFYLAVRDPRTRPRATQQSTLYHETYPGHHLQGALALEQGQQVHALARYLGNAGYSEGWALYAERVAQELGLYADAIDVMGLLSDQGARAARLVVDTGLHTLDWSREQAVDYMLRNTGWSRTDIENDVNRYISWPGQANSYMLGMLTITALRERAQAALGADFDWRDFHREVLRHGELPLPMLEEAIAHWLETGRRAASD